MNQWCDQFHISAVLHSSPLQLHKHRTLRTNSHLDCFVDSLFPYWICWILNRDFDLTIFVQTKLSNIFQFSPMAGQFLKHLHLAMSPHQVWRSKLFDLVWPWPLQICRWSQVKELWQYYPSPFFVICGSLYTHMARFCISFNQIHTLFQQSALSTLIFHLLFIYSCIKQKHHTRVLLISKFCSNVSVSFNTE